MKSFPPRLLATLILALFLSLAAIVPEASPRTFILVPLVTASLMKRGGFVRRLLAWSAGTIAVGSIQPLMLRELWVRQWGTDFSHWGWYELTLLLGAQVVPFAAGFVPAWIILRGARP